MRRKTLNQRDFFCLCKFGQKKNTCNRYQRKARLYSNMGPFFVLTKKSNQTVSYPGEHAVFNIFIIKIH